MADRMASLQPSAIKKDMINPMDAMAESLADMRKAESRGLPDVCLTLIAISLPANKPKNTQVVLIGIFE